MTVIDIEETTETGKYLLRNKQGIPIGYTLDEVFAEVDRNLSETYGIDFFKVNEMINSGKLDLDELTNEMLHGREFKYEPCFD